MDRLSHTALVLLAFVPGCASETLDGVAAPQVAISVAPLTLPGVGKVCYDLRVTAGADKNAPLVWAKGTPGLNGGVADPDAICSTTFGNGAGGGITFVGSCVAGPVDAGEAYRTNSVTIWVDGLYDSALAYIEPGGANGWQDPCPAGCTIATACRENSDTKVEFNLAILRQANQGFFDIGVNFEDIFCSAKVDCRTSGGEPLKLLFNPSTSLRDTTIVSAFACTAGAGSAVDTVMYRNPLVVKCGAQETIIDPAIGEGNAYTATNPDPAASDAVWQYAVYAGDEGLSCGGAPCNKRYWNVAIGLDATVDDCELTTTMTASAAPLAAFSTPSATTYPYVRVQLDLTDAAGLSCTQHPLDIGTGSPVSTQYTAISGPETFETSLGDAGFSKRDLGAAPVISATGGVVTNAGNYTIHTFSNNGTFTVNSGAGPVEVLVVGGGGGGGSGFAWHGVGGGGGGGGLIHQSYSVSPGSYTVVVGNGGGGGPKGQNGNWTPTGNGASGGNSAFADLVAIGGGGGTTFPELPGFNGGSGGGAGGAGYSSPVGGLGTAGQGYRGGKHAGTGGSNGTSSSGGGGGAGGAGGDGVPSGRGGDGGVGKSIDITGSPVMYASGGGGGASNVGGGFASSGGGAGGAVESDGQDAVAGRGGGGGGGSSGSLGTQTRGGNGAKGVVIVRYRSLDLPVSASLSTLTATPNTGLFPDSETTSTVTVVLRDSANNFVAGKMVSLASSLSGSTVTPSSVVSSALGLATFTVTSSAAGTTTLTASSGGVTLAQTPTVSFGASVVASGGTVTTDGAYTVHTFSQNDTFSVSQGGMVRVLVVGGGGGGGSGFWASACGGGGGGGGVVYRSGVDVGPGTYTVTVGAGGLGGALGATNAAGFGKNGGVSQFLDFIAYGGGGGTTWADTNGLDGASGGGAGGAGYLLSAGGAGIDGQGFAGGGLKASGGSQNTTSAGGGGGAGGPGADGVSAGRGGSGGPGLIYSVSGLATMYGSGGGGGASQVGGGFASSGGGAGGAIDGSGQDGVANRGGGGGGASSGSGGTQTKGGNGGSGVVILRYLTPAL
jgi:hypothetical protein